MGRGGNRGVGTRKKSNSKKRKGTDMIGGRAEKGMTMINLPKEVLSSRASSTPLWEFPGSSSLYAAF